jgi:hypothetical protein
MNRLLLLKELADALDGESVSLKGMSDSGRIVLTDGTIVPSGAGFLLHEVPGGTRDLVNGELCRTTRDNHVGNYAVLIDQDGPTDIPPNNPVVTITPDGTTTKTIRVQWRNPDTSNGNGNGEAVKIEFEGIVPVDLMGGVLGAAGELDFTLGPTDMCGRVVLRVKVLDFADLALIVKFE